MTHHSKEDIENLVPDKNSILISITGTLGGFANVNDTLYNSILRIRFSDIQRDFGKFVAFKEYQASQILTFIDSNIDADHIYINCEKGQSRSVALHSALERIYRDRCIDFPHQNMHVKNTLLKVAKII